MIGIPINVGVISILFTSIARRPGHLVLLLETSASVGEPRRDLGQTHLSDDGQHHLLALGRVGILDVRGEPILQHGCVVAGGVFATAVRGATANQPVASLASDVSLLVYLTEKRHHKVKMRGQIHSFHNIKTAGFLSM